MATVTRKRGGVEFDLRTIPPLKELQFRIDRFTKGISDWSGLLTTFGALFQRQMGEQFETEGAISGAPWARNEPTYALWKATMSRNRSRKVGVLSGALRSSLTGGGGYSERIGRAKADYGMSRSSPARPYGAYFDYVRPVIRMTGRWGRQYQKLTHQWLVAELRGSMGLGGAGLPELVRRGGGFGNLTHVDLRGT